MAPLAAARSAPGLSRVELLWFDDCPNHEAAATMLREVLDEAGDTTPITSVEVPDEQTGRSVRFPGSPTIRINGIDVEPGFVDGKDYTPRCRLYATPQGLRGLPAREWVVAAIAAARSAPPRT